MENKMNILTKIFELFSGIKMTITGGVFLAASLVLMLTNTDIPIDPEYFNRPIHHYRRIIAY